MGTVDQTSTMDIFDYLKQGAKAPGTADSSGYSKRSSNRTAILTK
jgi:hypothetical protein